jgi:AraC-like DNA-binding protein
VVAELVARYKVGKTSAGLSKEFGISKCGLLQLLRNEGATVRKQVIAPWDAERAAQLYESGLSITEVVERIGYSYSAIRKSLHERGVAMRPKGIKRKPL